MPSTQQDLEQTWFYMWEEQGSQVRRKLSRREGNEAADVGKMRGGEKTAWMKGEQGKQRPVG